MSGKGRGPEKGYNPPKYRDRFPFPERKIASQWCEDLNLFPMGPLPEGRLTEVEFRDALAKVGHMIRKEEPKAPDLKSELDE